MSELTTMQDLSDNQYDVLKKSIELITVLIAGADGEIDEQELNWAERLASIRSYAEPDMLNSFYEDVEKGFGERLTNLITRLPREVENRQSVICEELKGLNAILPILENKLAHNYYKSLLSFAEHIAKASGGFLRFGSISSSEKKWINLPMIEPIILEETDEETDEETE